MSERLNLFLLGALILISLYLGSSVMFYAICGLLFFEAATNIRVTTLSQKLRKKSLDNGLVNFNTTQRFNVDSMRVWRLAIGAVLLISYVALHKFGYDVIWFFPWFLGFAILGAGVSGVCPGLMFMRWLGFR